MYKLKNFMLKKAVEAKIAASGAVNKVTSMVQDRSGMSHSTEVLLWVLGSAVIVGIIITLAIALFKDELMPEFSAKVKEILNLK